MWLKGSRHRAHGAIGLELGPLVASQLGLLGLALSVAMGLAAAPLAFFPHYSRKADG